MKRKIFTLLMAFMALAAFQVNAQIASTGEVWIHADTTGIDPTLPYPGNKTGLEDWLDYNAATGKFVVKDGRYFDLKSNRFEIKSISGVLTQFNVNALSVTPNARLSLTYGTATYDNFEIVQFPNEAREPQAIDAGGNIEGYLTPAHQPVPAEASNIDQLFVVSDNKGALSVQPLSSFATYTAGTAADASFEPTGNMAPFTAENIGKIYSNGTNYVELASVNGADVNTASNSQQSHPNSANWTAGRLYISSTNNGNTNYVVLIGSDWHVAYINGSNRLVSIQPETTTLRPNNYTQGQNRGYRYYAITSTPSVTTTFNLLAIDANGKAYSATGVAPSPQSTNTYEFVPAVGTYAWKAKRTVTPVYIQTEAAFDCCLDEFVDAGWMWDERLLSLPVKNNALNSKGELLKSGMAVAADGFATLAEESTALTHKKVGEIAGGVLTLAGSTPTFAGFASDLPFDVYTVQSADGKYLTVQAATDQKNTASTDADVTGTKLGWADAIPYKATNAYRYELTQYFAIIDLCESGDLKGDNIPPYQRFVYLPLASYIVNYADGTIVKDGTANELRYNIFLGSEYICNELYDKTGAASQEAFRVGQYSVAGSNVYSLVVVGASGAGMTNNIPVEFTWTPGQGDIDFDCDWIVGNNANNPDYYLIDGTTKTKPTKYTVGGHWSLGLRDNQSRPGADPYLMVFTPELTEMCNEEVYQQELTGEYYINILKEYKEGETVIGYRIQAVNFDKESEGWNPTIETFDIHCTDHAVPFYNLEKHWNIDWMKLAAFEAVYVDRNLFADTESESSKIYNNGKVVSYRTRVNNVKPTAETGITYLTVYKNIVRELATNHVIPYYNFSITVGQEEFFLNVEPSNFPLLERDSVRFTKLLDSEIAMLLTPLADPQSEAARLRNIRNYTFCLPYAFAFNEDDFNFDEENPAVYLQTLDIDCGNENAPYIVRMGANTKVVNATRIDKAVRQSGTLPFTWNIHTMDYRALDQEYVTAFVFEQQISEDVEWVRLHAPVEQGEGTGILANADISTEIGKQYIKPSLETPVNYGVTTTTLDQATLTFKFLGKADIGNYRKKEIWYYNIIDAAGGLMTDASTLDYNKAGGVNKPYFYVWEGLLNNPLPYAYFGDAKAAFAKYADFKVSEVLSYSVAADEKFTQAFGLRYTTDGKVDGQNQKFYVVSRADFTNRTNPTRDYMYLANVQNRFVFVDNPASAMIFSFGNENEGNWTGIEDAQTATIIGADGAIIIRNAEGVANVYSVDGRLLNSTAITSAEQTISAPAGVAIVKIGDKVSKVIVK